MMVPVIQGCDYPRAPILEAVVELRFAKIADNKVKKVADVLRSQYDQLTSDQVVEGSLDFSKQEANFRHLSPKFRLASFDETEAFVITNENAVWNKLAPYEGWHSFYDRITRQLPKVLKTLGHSELIRIGMRYVNRIDYPLRDGLGYHEDYLAFRIVTNEFLDPTIGFQWQIRKFWPESKLSAVVQSAAAAPELPGFGAMMFDIDIVAEVEVPQKIDDILTTLCNMRDLKNNIFELGITDKARELFNEPQH